MFKKKVLAMGLTLAMVFSLAACGADDKKDDSNAKKDDKPKEEVTNVVESANKDVPDDQKLTFEDGTFTFAAINSAKGGSDAATLSVEDFNGSKALKVTIADKAKTPYVAFDLDAILGDNAEKVAKVEMDMGVLDVNGKFNACSGLVYAYAGKEYTETSAKWSVYMEDQNPKLASIDVTGIANGVGNMIQVCTDEDNAPDGSNMYIDNIVFRDASGNPLTVNTTGTFVGASNANVFAAPRDWSNIKEAVNEKEVQVTVPDEKGYTKPDGKASGTDVAFLCTAKQDGNENDHDHDSNLYMYSEKYPIITVYYKSDKTPVMIAESNKKDAPNKKVEIPASAVNGENNIAQWYLEDFTKAFGTDDVTKYFDVMSFRADGADIVINGVTIGSEKTIDDSKAVDYNFAINVSSGPNCMELPLKEVGEATGGKPIKKVIIQISGVLNNGEYAGLIDTDGSFTGGQTSFAMTVPGYNKDNWFYSDTKPKLGEPDPNGFYQELTIGDGYRGPQEVTYVIPEDVQAKMDFSAEGNVQFGVWYTASQTCVIDKVQYVTE